MHITKMSELACQRLTLLMAEMGLNNVYQHQGKVTVELKNGMNLQISDAEIKHQAIEHLNSMLQDIDND